jgi:uncharacterized protein YfaS (alpha-2-macroglobulin family)
LIEFENGQLDYTFVPSEMEGRLRAVALVVTEDGFGMTTEEIVVQDPVSLDISLPRFHFTRLNYIRKITSSME